MVSEELRRVIKTLEEQSRAMENNTKAFDALAGALVRVSRIVQCVHDHLVRDCSGHDGPSKAAH